MGAPQGILSRPQELGIMRCGKEAHGGMMASLTWAGGLQGVGFLTRREPGMGVGEGQRRRALGTSTIDITYL